MKRLTYEEKNHIEMLLLRCNQLSSIINNTVNPSDFFQAINELCNNLIYLSKYERYKIFSASIPSKDYECIKKNMEKTELNLLNRIQESCTNYNDFYNKVKPFYNVFSPIAQARISQLHKYYYPTIRYAKRTDSLFNSFMEILKLKKSNIQDDVYISDISFLPRYFIIRGKQYDIDELQSIESLPTDIYSTFVFKSKEYGIDTLLRVHAAACYKSGNNNLSSICTSKANELFNHGIYFESEEEKQNRIEQENREGTERILHEMQLQKTTIDVMMHFQKYFKYQLNCSIVKRYNMAFILLNKNNQFVALTDISFINEMIKQSPMLSIYIPENIGLCTEDICFTYKKSQNGTGYLDEPPYTYLEYVPFTKTYKYQKYPIKLHFSYENHNHYSYLDCFKDSAWGELEYFQDGSIGKGRLVRWLNSCHFTYYFKTLGRSLVISKIESNVMCEPSEPPKTIYKLKA